MQVATLLCKEDFVFNYKQNSEIEWERKTGRSGIQTHNHMHSSYTVASTTSPLVAYSKKEISNSIYNLILTIWEE